MARGRLPLWGPQSTNVKVTLPKCASFVAFDIMGLNLAHNGRQTGDTRAQPRAGREREVIV